MLNTIYKPEDIDNLIPKPRKRRKYGKISYYNIPCSFDIETSSFYEGEEKRAIMYIWALDIDGSVIMGRTWEEFVNVCSRLSKKCCLHYNQRHLIIYVHNLAYEFQWICQWFKFKKVFAVQRRRPVYAITNTGIEFRCSFLLSGYKLETVGKNLQKYKVNKLTGYLDYSKIRHSRTPLTNKELSYLYNDVAVVESYIREQIEEFHGIGKIPLTKTGKVRLYCRRNCFGRSHDNKINHFRRTINKLTLTPEEYLLCRSAFMGGFTHGNIFHICKNMYRIKSYDFTSSYPTQMVASPRFPMSAPKHVTIKTKSELRYYLKNYACIFEIYFKNLKPKILYENYLSESHCKIKGKKVLSGETVNNGRIVSCDFCGTTITEIDFELIETFYSWDGEPLIGDFIYFERGYLPTEFVKSVLELYGMKTTLKNVVGKESEYQNGKEMLNSCYGCTVTDIIREENIFSDKWEEPQYPDIETAIKKYNNNWQRFLYYPWGIYITSLSRMALFTGILEFGSDYVYSDTDSIKVRNFEKHEEYIKWYNDYIVKQLKTACDYHKFDYSMIEPETIEGVKKPLGVWDDEGIYDVFKFCGAKRYMTLKDGELQITIAGVNKETGAKYLTKKYGKYGAFQHFDDNLYFPVGSTGKMTVNYGDFEISGTVKDYTGIEDKYYEKSFIHLEESSYDLSINGKLKDYIEGVKTYEIL